MKLNIRSYEESDRPAIQRMSEQVTLDGTVFPFESVQGVLDYWFSEDSAVFVAETDHQVAGSYVIKPNQKDRCSHVANAGYMVDEQFRNQGIGRILAEHSLITAKRMGYLAMQFNLVVATNEFAIRLWDQLEFTKLARIPKAFRHPKAGLVDIWIMHREL